jgi:hypothetical protein
LRLLTFVALSSMGGGHNVTKAVARTVPDDGMNPLYVCKLHRDVAQAIGEQLRGLDIYGNEEDAQCQRCSPEDA